MTKTELYQNLMSRLDEVKTAGDRPVVIFDLDATLFDVGPRTCRIIHEYALQYDDKSLEAATKDYRKKDIPYLLEDILNEMGLYDEERLETLGLYWSDRFFTDHYQYYDEPFLGAPAFVHELHNKGAFIVYLSGRDAPGMLLGCTESLRRHGFPVGMDHTQIFLKLDFDTPDPIFKEEACQSIEELGEVIATFDNEPGNCNIFQARWPQAINVFLDTKRLSMAERPKPGTPSLENYDFSEIDLKG